jgi:RNA polymerase sigma-70 factor (ECF subfamily)
MLQSKSGGGAETLAATFPGIDPRRPAAKRSQDAPERELEGLYRAHAGQLRGFARRRVGWQEAEDLVQDVYVRLLQQGEFATLERPREYLYRVASNLAIDSARRVRTRSRFADEELEFSISQAAVTSPEKIVEGLMELRRFQAFLAELPPQARDILLLNRIEDLTHEEIADRLGVSVRTVERRIADALKRLRRRLGDGGP